MSVKAVVFDVDGTILDTRDFIVKSFEHSLAQHGHFVPNRGAIFAQVAGKALEECYVTLSPSGDILALCDTHRQFQQKRFDLIAAYDGLHDVLSEIRSRGMRIGIYSSRSKVTLRPSLEHMRLLQDFDAVIDGGDVIQHKPHPEGVLKVLEILDVSPRDAVMIGDTSADILAGQAAGCACTIGITHGLGSRESLETAGATYIVESLRAIVAFL